MAERTDGDNALSDGRSDGQRRNDRQRNNDGSGWNWLLVPAIVIPLLVPFYNRVEPTLFGWPFFYWGQLAFIVLGVATTSVVYQKTKTSKDPNGDRARPGAGPAEREGR